MIATKTTAPAKLANWTRVEWFKITEGDDSIVVGYSAKHDDIWSDEASQFDYPRGEELTEQIRAAIAKA